MYFNARVSTLQLLSNSIREISKLNFLLFISFGLFLVSTVSGQTYKGQTNSVSANNSVTIPKLTNLAVGDLMIAQISRSSDNNVDLTNATSAGWNLVSGNFYRSNSNDRWHVTVLSKFATTADVSVVGFTFTGTNADNSMGAISVFSNACQVGVIGSWGATTDDDTYSAPSISTLNNNAIVMMLGAVANDGRLVNDNSWTFNGSSMTERYDLEYDAVKDMGIAAATISLSSIQSGSGSATLSSAERNTSILLAIAGAPTVTVGSNLANICLGNSVNLNSSVSYNNSLSNIVFNGFESGDTWLYTNNTASGIATSTGVVRTGSNSLRFRGSNSNNVDPSITFSNVSLSGYTSARLSISFASAGVDANDDLFLDISYNNGSTWTSTKLIDGFSNFDCAFNAVSTTNTTSGVVVGSNPFVFNIPATESQVRVRIRFDESTGNDNTSDYYYIDDISISGFSAVGSLAWTSNPSGLSSTAQNPTVTPTQTTTYTLTATGSASCSGSANVTITLPTVGTALSMNNDASTCLVNSNGWVHFYHSSGRLIGSINSQGQNLGNVTVTSFVDATNTSVPSCANPSNQSSMTAVLQRHWLVIPQFQPTNPVLVRWPHMNSELTTLSSISTTNQNINDDAQVPQDLKLSKYDGVNENGNALDNCGTGTTTIYNQLNNGGPVSVYAPNITGAARYTDFQVPDFSEFWLHGSSTDSPLPVELTSFNTDCNEGKGVSVTWSTASEHNSSYFDVLKSEDGHNWRSIAIVSATGNSVNHIDYGVVDDEKMNGTVYYKLMQYDIDGKSKEYGPVSSNCNLQKEMVVKTYPNPSGQEFYVEVIAPESTTTVISIIDSHGKTVFTRTVDTNKGSNLYTFEELNILPGMYYIQISNDLTTPNVVKHSFR
ncbi:MAG: hypothetical protein RI922_2590 [Bacteroidota bacterium]|jgi:hypothetical protein